MAKWIVLRDGTVPVALARLVIADQSQGYVLDADGAKLDDGGELDVRVISGPNRGDPEGWYVLEVGPNGEVDSLVLVRHLPEVFAACATWGEAGSGLHMAGTVNPGADEWYIHAYWLEP